MTNVMAVATITVGATCRLMFTRLLAVRKASARMLKKANSTTKTTRIDSTPKCRDTKSDRAPRPGRRVAACGAEVEVCTYLPIMEVTRPDRSVSVGAISCQTTPS